MFNIGQQVYAIVKVDKSYINNQNQVKFGKPYVISGTIEDIQCASLDFTFNSLNDFLSGSAHFDAVYESLMYTIRTDDGHLFDVTFTDVFDNEVDAYRQKAKILNSKA